MRRPQALLKQQRLELSRQLQMLEQARTEQRQILLGQEVLAFFCDGMELLREHHARRRAAAGDTAAAAAHHGWSSAEEQAAGTSGSLPPHSSGSGASSATAGALEGAGEPPALDAAISQHGDRLWIVRALLQQPPLPAAATMSLGEMAGRYRATVRELALAVAQHDACSSSGSDGVGRAALQRMRDVLMQHIALLTSIHVHGRNELQAQFILTDCESGEQLQTVDVQRHTWAVQQAALSPDQRRWLAQCKRVTDALLLPVRREAQQLRAVLAAADEAAPGAADAAALSVQEREAVASRLVLLLRKEGGIFGMGFSSFVSCLSWPQLAKMCVLVYPRPLVLYACATQIAAAADAGSPARDVE